MAGELVGGSENAMWVRAIAGVVLCVIGAVWIGQGLGGVHGSPMTGHSQYALLGAVVVIIGLGLLWSAYRIRKRRTPR